MPGERASGSIARRADRRVIAALSPVWPSRSTWDEQPNGAMGRVPSPASTDGELVQQPLTISAALPWMSCRPNLFGG